MKPKVLLLLPGFSDQETVGNTKSMKNVLNIIPPIGLASIAGILENDGFNVKILDCTIGISHDRMMSIIRKFQPDVVGMSATSPTFESNIKAAKQIKEEKLTNLIIVGGPHPTAVPKETLEYRHFDIAVIGEGEHTFLELLQNYKNKKILNLSKIKGIAFRRGKKIIVNPRRSFIKDLDSLPFPARHLLPPMSKYSPTPASYRKLPQVHIMTTRGCPFQCTFCDSSIFGNTYRERSAKNVIEEVDLLIKNYNIKEVKFFDDTFTINKKRLYEICDAMKSRKIGWCCLTRVDSIDKKTLVKMKKSGCWQVLFGVESGNKQILKEIKKGITLSQVRRAIKWAKEAKLNIRLDFLIGTPSETVRTAKQTIKLAKELNSDLAHFNKFTPYPGTAIYYDLTKSGNKFDFSKNCTQLDHENFIYSPAGLTEKQFSMLINKAHREFYLRPRYIISQLLKIRSLEDINRLYRGFFAIFNL